MNIFSTNNDMVTYMGFNSTQAYAYIIWTHKETADQTRTICYEPVDVTNMVNQHQTPGNFRGESYMDIFYCADLPTNPDGSVDESYFWKQVEAIKQRVLAKRQLGIA